MKTFIKLLLLAAVALPSWSAATAQTDVTGQEVTPSPERTEAIEVKTVGWQEQFQNKAPDVAIEASAQPNQQQAKVRANASSADKKPVANGRARKAPATAQVDTKRSAPSMAPRGAAKAPPAGVEAEDWQIQTDWYDNQAFTSSTETGYALGSFGRSTVKVAISGNTVYIQGLSINLPEAWIEGTISGSTVTFRTGQFYGYGENNQREFWFVGEKNQEVADVQFQYDAVNDILTLSDYNYIVEGVTSTDLNGYGYHEGMVLMKVKTNEMITLSEADIRALENKPDGMFRYKYPINVENPTKEGTLLDHVVVTDEESAGHAIALLRAVYTNKYLPGPYYRGYTTAGEREGSVSYAGVGSIKASMSNTYIGSSWGSSYYHSTLSNIEWQDALGWKIEPREAIITKRYPEGDGTSTSHYIYRNNNYYQNDYAYFDPTDYKPEQEGYTLLLVEVQDVFKTSDIWDNTNKKYKTFSNDPYENLVQYVLKTIKSVRLLTEAKRTGTNIAQGSLFKIDANKLNRFFIISKGQARYKKNSYVATGGTHDFCDEPYYGLSAIINSSNYITGYEFSYQDIDGNPIFYHMFEEFSPSMASGGSAKSDIYKTLVTGLDATGTNKTGFPVFHDCSTVPYAEAEKVDATTGEGKGHEFKMLGDTDPITNAPNVRDLLFFVPDYRLTNHTDTSFPDNTTNSRDPNTHQKFVYYNQDRAPRMDMYVIHLDPILGEQVQNEETGVYEHVYQLELNWKSNMSSFLPATEQRFTLWRKVTDADGSSDYQPVYRVNQMGRYVDANGQELSDQNDESLRVQVEMQGVYSLNVLDYFDYVPMDPTGKEVTYYVKGRDTGEFLSLQNSNEESYLIPGYDKNVRLTLKIDTDNYSKFDMANQKNNYWNEISVANNYGTSVTANFLEKGTIIDFSRRDLSISNADSVIVARATVEEKTNSTITVSMVYPSSVSFTGSKDNLTSFTFTYPSGQQEGVVDFGDWTFYDNFQAEVSQNNHPGRYVYRAFFHAAQKFLLDDNVTQSNLVYSNVRGFKVFKTEPNVNSTFTLQEVLDDSNMSVELKDNSVYKIEVERSPLSELWRYEVCRWAENTTQDTFTYFGDAQNQSNEDHYSLSFDYGLPQYYNNVNAPMTPGVNTATVEFEDRDLKANGGAYNYVPQVVVYTKRSDNNTYGAPRKTTAIGKLELKPYVPTPDEIDPEKNGDPSLAQMSEYKWFMNGKWYSYYNLMFNFHALDLPSDEYELYKLRAWRRIVNLDENDNVVSLNNSILGEELETRRKVRIEQIDKVTGWYMYEDINFGDPLEVVFDEDGHPLEVDEENGKLMSCGTLHPGLAENDGELLGHRSTFIPKPQNPGVTGDPDPLFEPDNTPNQNATTDPDHPVTVEDLVRYEMRSTFGAERMKIEGDNSGTLDKDLNAEFKVRAYFVKKSDAAGHRNPLVTIASTRDEVVANPADFDYYVAEGTALYKMAKGSSIITGIGAVKMDVNREVVGVSYVNPIGQMSSTPWQGVNIVVTRYSDGSTTTQKVIR